MTGCPLWSKHFAMVVPIHFSITRTITSKTCLRKRMVSILRALNLPGKSATAINSKKCIEHMSVAICRRNGTVVPEIEPDVGSRLHTLQAQKGDPNEVVRLDLKREEVDYLVKVLHHHVADLNTVDFNQQICVQDLAGFRRCRSQACQPEQMG